MQNANLYVSELSTSRHVFSTYHFCRGNSNRRKTRLGVILKGSGAYIYLNKRLDVREGDVVFIPENIYCYSEWHGSPEIEVVYLSCFLHYEGYRYEPQRLDFKGELREEIVKISDLLAEGGLAELEAYSRFYRLLMTALPQMVQSTVVFDKALQTAIEYITENWNRNFSVSDLAKAACVSESAIYHLFQKELGQTPIRFLNSIRINVAIEYLENTDWSVSTVSRTVGFNSENHFRRVFAEYTGTTPLKFRKLGRRMP
jgi:AraC-like DNA-binding protein